VRRTSRRGARSSGSASRARACLRHRLGAFASTDSMLIGGATGSNAAPLRMLTSVNPRVTSSSVMK